MCNRYFSPPREQIGFFRPLVPPATYVGGAGRINRTSAPSSRPGDKIREPTLAQYFAEARDASGLTWPEGKTPPTFHEMRSLSAWLYDDQGIHTQSLLGHKSADMTNIYRDTRGAEWIDVKVA